jgi:hypothetical protein
MSSAIEALYRNPDAASRKKSAENPAVSVDYSRARRPRFVMTEAMQAAISLAKRFGLPLSHRNLYVIELAVLAESDFRQILIPEAASNIREGAMAEIVRGGSLNYFFFEDAGWRFPRRETKADRNRMEASVGASTGLDDWRSPTCSRCNDRRYIFNYGPGKRTKPCPECCAEVPA